MIFGCFGALFPRSAAELLAGEVSTGEKLFALKVKPLLAQKCNACHGDDPKKIKGDLDMRTRESMLRGGETYEDEVLIPGKGEKSFLYILSTRVEEDMEMPPKEADKLTKEQTWWIRDWINEGAPLAGRKERVPAIQEKYAEGEQVATSKALSEDWQKRRYETKKLWAYRPLKVEKVPEGEHPVDLVREDRKLKEAGLVARPGCIFPRIVSPPVLRADRVASRSRSGNQV